MPVHVRKYTRHAPKTGKPVTVGAHTRSGNKRRLPKSEAASLLSHEYKPKSSFLDKITYQPKLKALTVHIGAKRYTYHNVPSHEYDGLVKSKSTGSYFATHIKKYKFTKH